MRGRGEIARGLHSRTKLPPPGSITKCADEPEKIVQTAVTYARDHLFGRPAVESELAILTAALDRSMGEATFAEVRQQFDAGSRRASSARSITGRRPGMGMRVRNTRRMRCCAWEREILDRMQAGNQRGYSDPMLVLPGTRIETEDRHPELNQAQQKAVDEISPHPACLRASS